MKNLLCLLIFLCPFMIFAQDTITVVYYNVLNYPNPSNNDPQGNDNARAIAFREIMEEADADIILIEELKSATGADMLKNELNNNTQGKVFDRAPQFFGYGNSSLGNMIFFNTNLSSLIFQEEVPRINSQEAPDGSINIAPRPNSYYELEVFSPANPVDKDTIHFFVGHFKASDSNHSNEPFLIPDNERRVLSALDIMDYTNTNLQPTDNIMAGGDFNFYSYLSDNTNAPFHDEPAYDSLINPVSYPIHFIDKQGPWTRDSAAPSSVTKYTQSTRLNYNEYGNEGASAGLDDRFDFALINDALDLGLKKTRYIEGSNIAFGSPNQLDVSVLSGNSPVKNQLHAMSDHLPVLTKLAFNYSTECLIAGVSTNGSCQGIDYTYEVSFGANYDSGTYEVVDITNGNTVLATDTISPISITISSITDTTAFQIVVRDALDTSCVSLPTTITPENCSTNCGITITAINTICQPDSLYDLEVCFDYQNPASDSVNIIVAGQFFGAYPLPTVSGECIVIPSNTLNMTGDGSAMLEVLVQNVPPPIPPTEPFISEFHYDNGGTDVGEFIEITAANGTDLSEYTLYFYNGNGNIVYNSYQLSGAISNVSNTCEAVAFQLPFTIQNGAPDAIALVNNISSEVLEFISYEGTLVASGGPANGMTSIDINVQESSGTSAGFSLQKTDAGWVGPIPETPSVLNDGLTSCSSGSGSVTCEASSTYDEPDCSVNTCPMNLVENTSPIPDGAYQASENISSSAELSNTGNVIFNAGVSIDLLPGFYVPQGAEFLGIIGGCTP